jgi:hypothetical protein
VSTHLNTINLRDETISQKIVVISQRDESIKGLEMEIKRLQDLIAQGGQESGELGRQLVASQKALAEAEEKIRKLQGELLA